MRIIDIQKATGMNYTTIHEILKNFAEMGHINYKWDRCAKKFILQFRQSSKEAQQIYK